ncbi:22808_t:CDS:2, partial [Racocetra persica]
MVEELISDEEMCLDDFFNVFNNFMKTLQDNLILDSLLLPNATLFIREDVQHGKISSGTEYVVPLDTDFENWIYDFGYNTHTSYVQERTEYNTGNIEFRYTYKCYRSGKYKSQADQNPIKKARIIQKDSKKIGSESTIIVTKTKGDYPQMIIKYTLYSNHTPDVKAIGQFFRKQAHDLDKIWNQCNNLKHNLLENGDLTCAIAQSESNNNENKGQLLGFIIPITKEIIYNINTVLLNTTHSTNKKIDLLYTLLLPDFKTGKGLPLAHLISSCK